MAICTKQDAFGHFRPGSGDGTRDACCAKTKGFGRRVKMMKLESGLRSVKSTHLAASARLGDEELLNLSPTLCNTGGVALSTSNGRLADPKRRPPVNGTLERKRVDPSLPRLSDRGCALAPPGWAQLVLIDPVVNPVDEGSELVCDLPQCQPIGYETTKLLAIERSFSTKSRPSIGVETVLRHPVPDRSGRAPGDPADLRKRPARRQMLFQEVLVHLDIVPVHPDRKTNARSCQTTASTIASSPSTSSSVVSHEQSHRTTSSSSSQT